MTRSTRATTYDDDFYAWTQEQAAALRRMPAPGAEVDVTHVAEEIEDLGKRDFRDVTLFLAILLEHLVKIDCNRDARDVPHWRGESLNFHVAAMRGFSPGMRQLIETADLWRLAGKRVRAAREKGVPNLVMADRCPLTLDDLLTEDFDLEAALTKFASARP